jgi:archaeosine synthase
MIKVLCTNETSLHRPEARRWRERMGLLEPLGEVVVVLPCSMRKPYSSSKSHRIFSQATRGFQEAILTSPFGVCPREMENTYPIQSYDVSTVGDWSLEEIALTGECLAEYVQDKEVIAHVAHGYLTVCQEYLPNAIFTCIDGRTTSSESMQNLKKEVKKYGKIKSRKRQTHMLRSIARYQFNTQKADKLVPSNYKLIGRFDRRLMHENEQIAVLHHDNGLYSLNMKGGILLNDIGVNWVEIDFDLKTNTLFAPGVVDAYPKIIPKDEVVIIRNGEVIGVGKSLMSGEEMKKGEKGVAVRVRHRLSQ